MTHTRTMVVVVALVAVACGPLPGDPGLGNPDSGTGATLGLQCNAISYCSSMNVAQKSIPRPSTLGGAIPDGLYRKKSTHTSTTQTGVSTLLFSGNQVHSSNNRFETKLGTYTTTASGEVIFAFTLSCERTNPKGSAVQWTSEPFPYSVSGSVLTLGDDIAGGVARFSEYERIEAPDLCTENADVRYSQGDTNRTCASVKNGFGLIPNGSLRCLAE
ncbi:MAG: hypothetical protein Q8N26_00820 [Myxococcales bacterium]|nr:hypothetical protein [Myxococcales bacterium]